MGSCFSSSTSNSASSRAVVITVDGTLKEYPAPVTVSSVLGSDHPSSFLCSSDSLNFGTCIPALDLEVLIEMGQIYFVLPVARVDVPLSGSDMAVLAVKASSAFAAASKRGGKRRIHVMPVERIYRDDGNAKEVDNIRKFNEFSVGIRKEIPPPLVVPLLSLLHPQTATPSSSSTGPSSNGASSTGPVHSRRLPRPAARAICPARPCRH